MPLEEDPKAVARQIGGVDFQGPGVHPLQGGLAFLAFRQVVVDRLLRVQLINGKDLNLALAVQLGPGAKVLNGSPRRFSGG
jgi:hypothetical protein